MDCYSEDEEFAGVMCALGEGLRFPLKACHGQKLSSIDEMIKEVGT